MSRTQADLLRYLLHRAAAAERAGDTDGLAKMAALLADYRKQLSRR